jgi:ABC-type amino acid transport substrate-binding protein
MIDDVAGGKLDASVAAMTMTGAREQVIDFSYAFYRSGLGVAVAKRPQAGLSAIWEALTSRAFLSVAGALAGVLFVVGALVWLFERKHNSAQFEGDPKRGLFSGFWWAAVTMTTTGYGDKAPTTVGGRILAILWMFTALVVTSGFTAQLAATLTARSIQSPVTSPTDLALVRVGNVAGAASTAALQSYGVRPRAYADVIAGLKAVAGGEIDAFVHAGQVGERVSTNAKRAAEKKVAGKRQHGGHAIQSPQIALPAYLHVRHGLVIVAHVLQGLIKLVVQLLGRKAPRGQKIHGATPASPAFRSGRA